MAQSPGYWTYAGSTGGAALAAFGIAAVSGISGYPFIALPFVTVAAAVYLVTPGAQRSDIPRLLVIGGLGLAGVICAGITGLLAYAVFFRHWAEGEGHKPEVAIALAALIGAVSYFAGFAQGWPLVRPPSQAPLPPPATPAPRRFG